MSIWGKLLGGVFGYLMGGLIGALIGIAIGHYFDRSLVRSLREQFDPQARQRVQTTFFTALFSVMGHLAKADGRVTETEIQLAREVMDRMNLGENLRQEAIRLFTEGKKADFPIEEVLTNFRIACRQRRNIMQMFLEILLHSAYADGKLDDAERVVVTQVYRQLGFSDFEFAHIEAMVRNASHFRSGGFHQQQGMTPESAIDEAYEILGVSHTVSDTELKRAYRRLMNQHHPDKLVAKGLPEEMTRMATEKTQEIKEAYDLIRKTRQAA